MPFGRAQRRGGTGHNFFRRRGQSAQRVQRANVLSGTDVTFNLGGDVTGSQEMIGGNIFIPSSSISRPSPSISSSSFRYSNSVLGGVGKEYIFGLKLNPSSNLYAHKALEHNDAMSTFSNNSQPWFK